MTILLIRTDEHEIVVSVSVYCKYLDIQLQPSVLILCLVFCKKVFSTC
jgi:hypothetical protein